MSRWVKNLHMYAGLLNLTILLVFGIAGLTATFDSGPNRSPLSITRRTMEFTPPANAGDFEAATAAYDFLKLPLSGPPPKYTVHRNAGGDVTFDIYTVNGPTTVTLLEKEHRVRVEARRNNLAHFFDNMHATTMNSGAIDPLIRMWTWYTEFSIWSLIFMSITGVWLWLASRPRHRWAQISFAAGSGVFLLLYAITR
jgi:hypothetical protein